MIEIAILGAGPHGRSIAAFPEIHGYLYDDDHTLPWRPIMWGAMAYPWVIGAAWPWVRKEIDGKLHGADLKRPYNQGIVVFDGARVSIDDTEFGPHVHVCQNAIVSHGCVLREYVTVCPGAILCGDVEVGAGVLIGAGAVVLHTGIKIGDNAKIGAGAVVLQDVPANATVIGNPARVVEVASG